MMMVIKLMIMTIMMMTMMMMMIIIRETVPSQNSDMEKNILSVLAH